MKNMLTTKKLNNKKMVFYLRITSEKNRMDLFTTKLPLKSFQ